MIEVRYLSLTIKGKQLLNKIDMVAKSGEITGLVGPNGSGKTLIMKCICGFFSSYEGEIVLDGKPATEEERKNIGAIIETPGFIPYYSGYKNLKILAQINKKCSKQDIYDSMNTVGLDPSDRRPIRKYSLGMRQRLGVAQTLMEDPAILIMDEPFNGLDAEMTEKLRNRLNEEANKGKTIILSSHNPIDIEMLCNQTYYIQKGSIK